MAANRPRFKQLDTAPRIPRAVSQARILGKSADVDSAGDLLAGEGDAQDDATLEESSDRIDDGAAGRKSGPVIQPHGDPLAESSPTPGNTPGTGPWLDTSTGPHTPASPDTFTPPDTRPPRSASLASLRHPLSRTLSPDLPTRDALYLFCNFSSYMRSPQEGAEGIKDNTDFGDTIRLLDFARHHALDRARNVKVLHMKYRFQTPELGRQGKRDGQNAPAANGAFAARTSRTVPQPFSVLQDNVIKLDYQDTGIFSPLPAQAVFAHIAKACQPPPRIIVVSYVCSRATENHIAAIAHWAFTSSPPIYVFSPLETRLRERRPLEESLHHAIPISMYAEPWTGPSLDIEEHKAVASAPGRAVRRTTPTSPLRGLPSPVQVSPVGRASSVCGPSSYRPRSYPLDPVATLNIISDDSPIDHITGDPVADRIPLWTLAPGVGILHGSTSVSLGVRLSDFSAMNLVRNKSDKDREQPVVNISGMAIKTSPMTMRDVEHARQRAKTDNNLTALMPPVRTSAAGARSQAATPEPISRPGSTVSSRRVGSGDAHRRTGMEGHVFNMHVEGEDTPHTRVSRHGADRPDHANLTPPDQDPRHLSPPDAMPPRPLHQNGQALDVAPPSLTLNSWPSPKSWPIQAARVPGWRRGRRVNMEDALDEIAAGRAAGAGDDKADDAERAEEEAKDGLGLSEELARALLG